MKNVIEKGVTGGATVLDEAWQYSYASAEYAGLVLYSYVRRGGSIVIEPLDKIASPVFSNLGTVFGRTFGGVREGVKKVFAGVRIVKRLGDIDKRLSHIEEMLVTKEALYKLEERLAYLERHGIVASKEGGLQLKGKKLSEDKLMLLRAIVKENIILMEE